jgi:hypothetical protein
MQDLAGLREVHADKTQLRPATKSASHLFILQDIDVAVGTTMNFCKYRLKWVVQNKLTTLFFRCPSKSYSQLLHSLTKDAVVHVRILASSPHDIITGYHTQCTSTCPCHVRTSHFKPSRNLKYQHRPNVTIWFETHTASCINHISSWIKVCVLQSDCENRCADRIWHCRATFKSWRSFMLPRVVKVIETTDLALKVTLHRLVLGAWSTWFYWSVISWNCWTEQAFMWRMEASHQVENGPSIFQTSSMWLFYSFTANI